MKSCILELPQRRVIKFFKKYSSKMKVGQFYNVNITLYTGENESISILQISF